MKKLALLALGLAAFASTCYADAEITVKDVDAAYLQKYVMDNFYQQNTEYTLESWTAEKVTYVKKKPLTKKDVVIGQGREEVCFTTVQQGEDVVLGLTQHLIANYRDGRTENTKNSDDLNDKIFLNQYRTFFNDTYSFGFTPDTKESKEGVRILNVYGFGPMHDAGIANGSIITAVNGVSVAGKLAEVTNNIIPDQFDGTPVTFTIKAKNVAKDYTLTPTMKECKYTKIKQARAKAAAERKEGKRGIESWLKLE